MRLFLNDREVRLLKTCVHMEMVNMTGEQREMMERVLDRIELCEKLQKNENKSKRA